MIDSLRGIWSVDVYLSPAASEVLAMYGLAERVRNASSEKGRSFPESSKFSVGRYDALVISPATGNTVAKCAGGIADSLVSCMFAQAGKSRVPICVLPTDVSSEMETTAPDGSRVMVYPRRLDLNLCAALEEIDGVTVVSSPGELRRWITGLETLSS
jgi:flavoprotein